MLRHNGGDSYNYISPTEYDELVFRLFLPSSTLMMLRHNGGDSYNDELVSLVLTFEHVAFGNDQLVHILNACSFEELAQDRVLFFE